MTNQSPLLDTKTALVTGATSGIGKAIALLFLESGINKLIAVGTNYEKGKRLQEEFTALGYGEKLIFSQKDVSKKSDIDLLFQEMATHSIMPDIVVNNAGVTRDTLLMRMSEDDWNSVLDINLKSCFYICQAASKWMIKSRSGSIINISSVVGLIGNPGQTNYAASKAGMIGFSKSLARELASRNIRVNCIAPGFIDTNMTDTLGSEKKEHLCKTIPMGRMGSSQDIAQAALFLASSMSSYMTGQVITIDGGLCMS
ncbi:MAG: 3-oxoacyl-[acyl-carrier-protein] reductase [Chlamydia sp.]